jgi:acyl carrier protein
MEDVYAGLTEVFHDVFDDDSIVVTPELTASNVEDWNSLNHIRLIVAVERRFKIKISAAQSANLKNVGDLAELIRTKMSAK